MSEDAEAYARWQKAQKTVSELAPAVEETIAAWLAERGLTATSTKHLWLDESLAQFAIREGAAPPDMYRPDYLKGLQLDICQFRLPGVIVGYMDSVTRKFVRVKRSPKMGELSEVIAKLEARGAQQIREQKEQENTEGTNGTGPAVGGVNVGADKGL